MGVRGQLHVPAALYSRKRTHGTSWIGSCVGLRGGLGTEAKGKIIRLCRDRTRVVQSVVRHYTDWATPSPFLTLKSFKLLHWLPRAWVCYWLRHAASHVYPWIALPSHTTSLFLPSARQHPHPHNPARTENNFTAVSQPSVTTVSVCTTPDTNIAPCKPKPITLHENIAQK
jgi:hypothetical protein